MWDVASSFNTSPARLYLEEVPCKRDSSRGLGACQLQDVGCSYLCEYISAVYLRGEPRHRGVGSMRASRVPPWVEYLTI